MDVGSGTGCLIPHLQQRGVRDILAVDLADGMLAKVLAASHTCAPYNSQEANLAAQVCQSFAVDDRLSEHDEMQSVMRMQLRKEYATESTLGNEPGVRTWQGDVQSVPAYQAHFFAGFYLIVITLCKLLDVT